MPLTHPISGLHSVPAVAGTPPQAAAQPKRRIQSQALFGDQIELEIEHRSQVYRLRQTALGKLILTK
jgi:hemin uptake protein HemP